MILFLTRQTEVGETISEESKAGCVKVNTSVENEPVRYKEKKVYELQILGHPKEWVRLSGQVG